MDFFDFLIGVKKVKIFHCYSKKKCILDNIEHAAASGGGDSTVVCTSEFRVKKIAFGMQKNLVDSKIIRTFAYGNQGVVPR